MGVVLILQEITMDNVKFLESLSTKTLQNVFDSLFQDYHNTRTGLNANEIKVSTEEATEEILKVSTQVSNIIRQRKWENRHRNLTAKSWSVQK